MIQQLQAILDLSFGVRNGSIVLFSFEIINLVPQGADPVLQSVLLSQESLDLILGLTSVRCAKNSAESGDDSPCSMVAVGDSCRSTSISPSVFSPEYASFFIFKLYHA